MNEGKALFKGYLASLLDQRRLQMQENVIIPVLRNVAACLRQPQHTVFVRFALL